MKEMEAFEAAHPLHVPGLERSHKSEKSDSIEMMLE